MFKEIVHPKIKNHWIQNAGSFFSECFEKYPGYCFSLSLIKVNGDWRWQKG